MNKNFFIKTLTMTMLGLIIFIALPLYYLSFTKEILDYREIEKLQETKNVKLGFYFRDFKEEMGYKLYKYLSNDYPIIALGNSRVMQFKEYFFKNKKFYNLGGIVQDLNDYNEFISFLPKEKLPKIIIVSMDHFFFNDNFPKSNVIDLNEITKEKSKIEILFNLNKIFKSYKLFFSNYTLKQYNKENIGYLAQKTGNGFLRDGSYYYNNIIVEQPTVSEKIKDSLERIKRKELRFEIGKEISKESLKEIEKFIRFCKLNNIEVIGFLPPYSDFILKEMKLEENNYAYVFNLMDELHPIFKKYNYELYDFTSIRDSGGEDEEIIDGFHGTTVFYLRIFIKMVEMNQNLKNYSKDVEELKRYLKNKSSEYEIF